MRIKTFGYRGIGETLSKIEKGFESFGHEIVEDNPDIVYCNNGLYDEALEFLGEKGIETSNKKIKSIFNVLDVPTHVQHYPFEKLGRQLFEGADTITTISETVCKQINSLFDLPVDKVIYQPTQNIYPMKVDEEYKEYKYLFVGRANDANKRFDVVKDTLIRSKEEGKLLVVGTENPHFGKYVGPVDEKILNKIYNSVDYIWLPSDFEGIGLPAIEAILAEKIPLLNMKNPTSLEFLPDFAERPYPEDYLDLINTIEANKDEVNKVVKQYRKRFLEIFDYKNVARNILSTI